MKIKKILLISNDKIYLKNRVISNEFNDTLNIIEAIHNHFNLFIISRSLKKKSNFTFKFKNKIKRFYLKSIFSFRKKNLKIFMISITPRNFLLYFLLCKFSDTVKGYVYLRSNGHLEYKSKIGTLGYFIYDIMYKNIQKRLKIIKVSKNIISKGKVSFLIPSELDSQWLKKVKKKKQLVPKLLYLGRYKKEKGFFSLLNLVKNFDFEFKLTVAGDDNIFWNKKKNVSFVPKISDKNKLINLYDDHDIFILPSFTEGSPKVILESLARKKPVIIFKDIKHVRLSLKGVFICKRETGSLKNKIFYILSNYSKIQRMMKENNLPTKKKFQNNLVKILNDLF
tara:strand:+ start:1747 stop:2760 length:1014 start_codon:yes stop_codon:yes gene_type:complete